MGTRLPGVKSQRRLRLGPGWLTYLVLGIVLFLSAFPFYWMFVVASRSSDAMGQVPFYPPNVSGWPANAAWLSPVHLHARAVLLSQLTMPAAAATTLTTTAFFRALQPVNFYIKCPQVF
mgnify:CR=1 FL=1